MKKSNLKKSFRETKKFFGLSLRETSKFMFLFQRINHEFVRIYYHRLKKVIKLPDRKLIAIDEN